MVSGQQWREFLAARSRGTTTATLAKRKPGSIGLPVTGTECKVVDLKTGEREVPVGEAGELCVRGPQVMKGYWNKPDETAIASDGHGSATWGQVADAVLQLAAAIQASDLGASRRVLVVARNLPATVVAHAAALLGEAASGPVNFHLTAGEIAYIADVTEARLAFVDDAEALVEADARRLLADDVMRQPVQRADPVTIKRLQRIIEKTFDARFEVIHRRIDECNNKHFLVAADPALMDDLCSQRREDMCLACTGHSGNAEPPAGIFENFLLRRTWIKIVHS